MHKILVTKCVLRQKNKGNPFPKMKPVSFVNMEPRTMPVREPAGRGSLLNHPRAAKPPRASSQASYHSLPPGVATAGAILSLGGQRKYPKKSTQGEGLFCSLRGHYFFVPANKGKRFSKPFLSMGKETVLHSKESHQRENPFGIPCQVYTPPLFISARYNRSLYKPHEHFTKLHHPHGARHRTGCTGDLAKLRAEPSAAGRAGKRTNSEMDELSSRLTEASDMELVRTRGLGFIRGRRLLQSLPLMWISLDTFFVHAKKVSPPRPPGRNKQGSPLKGKALATAAPKAPLHKGAFAPSPFYITLEVCYENRRCHRRKLRHGPGVCAPDGKIHIR